MIAEDFMGSNGVRLTRRLSLSLHSRFLEASGNVDTFGLCWRSDNGKGRLHILGQVRFLLARNCLLTQA